MASTAIVWLKRDLRVADHTPLHAEALPAAGGANKGRSPWPDRRRGSRLAARRVGLPVATPQLDLFGAHE